VFGGIGTVYAILDLSAIANTHNPNGEKTMNATSRKNENGTYRIELNGKVVRKESNRFFPFVYSYDNGTMHRLAKDGQLQKNYGNPIVTAVIEVK
jgi:hypothetical protein